MIRIEIIRSRSTPLGTPGHLVAGNGFGCDTLELPWHNNQNGKSCTAAGIDRGRVWWSPMLGRLVIRLGNRNGRYDCLIHNGNFAADAVDLDGDGAPEVTQVHGCTEVGSGYGEILRKDGRKQWGVRNSGATLAALLASLADGSEARIGKDGFATGYHEVEITYRWAPGCNPEGQ